jgi:hypothetical protein
MNSYKPGLEQLEDRCLLTIMSLSGPALVQPGQAMQVNVNIDRLYDYQSYRPQHQAPQVGMLAATAVIDYDPSVFSFVFVQLGVMGMDMPGNQGFSAVNPNGFVVVHIPNSPPGEDVFNVYNAQTGRGINAARGGTLIQVTYQVSLHAVPQVTHFDLAADIGGGSPPFTFVSDNYDPGDFNLPYILTPAPQNNTTWVNGVYSYTDTGDITDLTVSIMGF